MAATDVKAATPPAEVKPAQAQLEGGTYEILRNRLGAQAKELDARLAKLNALRKETFGGVEMRLLDRARITTEHNCVARDMVSVGERFLFGYNVQFGLKTTTEPKDVFAIYRFQDHQFHPEPLDPLKDPRFLEDFANLYKYYKETTFAKFWVQGPHLFMVFQVGKRVTDIKTFKWALQGGTLTYLDNRSDHEFRFPPQHEFEWRRTHRDLHREGKHPHISIDDRVFVETVGGDLTIKVEDNTSSGAGIYTEPVDNPDQVLDDAEIYYASVGPLILLKIKPYQERNFRYLVFNEKLKEVRRIDAIEHSCVLLPDDHGLIFSSGYYLVSGEFKNFDHGLRDMLFERRIASPNGEDTLFVFYNRESGQNILLSYNLIEQTVATPILCQGYSLFPDGELVYFSANTEPQKHHPLQVWQTPYLGPNAEPHQKGDTALYKIGNKDVVRAMAESREVIKLIGRESPYEGLYLDLIKKTSDLVDSYFWLGEGDLFNLREVLDQVRTSATSAMDEFEKVARIRKQTAKQIGDVSERTRQLLLELSRRDFPTVDGYVAALNDLRVLRGEIISLKDLRYADLPAIDKLEEGVRLRSEELSQKTVEFLLQPDALTVYEQRVEAERHAVPNIAKVTEAKEHGEAISAISSELELLIEIVSNLKIEDSTKTTAIIDSVSAQFQRLNQVRQALSNKRKELAGAEAVAEFGAQLKLLSQSVVNFLDLCDTVEKCDEYLTKLLVQVEELEGRFADFDEYVLQLAEKRTEISNAFETKRTALVEARNKRAVTLQQAADRILKGVDTKARSLKSVNDINGYFATDLMIDKVRGTIEQLRGLGDSVKADEVQSRLKTIKEDALRQLKDKLDLYGDGGNSIQFGKHTFSVNTQPLDLTTILRDGELFYHITGTNFFEKVEDAALLATRPVWNQDVVSENPDVYRAEYLAYHLLEASEAQREGVPTVAELAAMDQEALKAQVQKFMTPRYAEGYVKGVHDTDGAVILRALLDLNRSIGLLRYSAPARAMARLWFRLFGMESQKRLLATRLRGIRAVLKALPHRLNHEPYVKTLERELYEFVEEARLFPTELVPDAAEYLYFELTRDDHFVISPEAAVLTVAFQDYLKKEGLAQDFGSSLQAKDSDPSGAFDLVRVWLRGYLQRSGEAEAHQEALDEAAALLLTGDYDPRFVHESSVHREVTGLVGSHGRIAEGRMEIHYPRFMERLDHFEGTVVPMYQEYQRRKKESADAFRETLRLEEFKPRILSSFVRNRLIDEVYLPLIGDNLAKQMGTVGAGTRTDRMGMLLVISPPGYGKTTLMEYIANRLGIIFMKINGPAIGHLVTSLDPAEAPNATARMELEKLNLSLEMGDNVMIYLDDIQHTNPELLQKFISLCDATRRIEGVYKGRTRTYDLRGRKVAVVMAGNPYTESGTKFQIPDMLANRADTYNLGDIIGDTRAAFELSYIENSMTSNRALARLAAKNPADIHAMLKIAQSGSREGVNFEGTHSAEEVNEYVSVLQKMMAIRDVILRVNEEYIASAAQADEFRTEPPFKLQGSYRNMNKLAEKVQPIMNEAELRTLILTHYENESQTLTTGAEANLLKFKILFGYATREDEARWAEIVDTFRRNQKFRGLGDGQADSMAQVLTLLSDLSEGLGGVNTTLARSFSDVASRFETLRPKEIATRLAPETWTDLRDAVKNVLDSRPAPPPPPAAVERDVRAQFSPEAVGQLHEVLRSLALAVQPAPAALPPTALSSNGDGAPGTAIPFGQKAPKPGEAEAEWKPKDGDFHRTGSLRSFLEEFGFTVEERTRTNYVLRREAGLPITLLVQRDRYYWQAEVGTLNGHATAEFFQRLLALNREILPVSFALEENRLLVVESREGASLTRTELETIVRSLDAAAERAGELTRGKVANG